ncbi:adenylate/guanylate cyclase domain-containing protein [Rhizobium sp. LjRoot254]|uniref:adenylate/guanylate cyclase domain-containing protein n=1 Tax=Rhizobium sp. LjRoot254 TaxID=3342297 RepID=UPI003ECE058F
MARWVLWLWEPPWSSRLAEERLARRNPHLARALELEKMEGQRIATWARAAAMAVVALLLIYLNPRWEMLYYEAILLLFVVIGIAQLRAARVGQSFAELGLISADILLLTLTMTLPNPLASDPWPTAFQFQFDGFQYFYIFLASAMLAYSWRTVQGLGVWVAVIWLCGVGGVALFGTTYPELSDRVREAVANYPRIFDAIDPNSVNFTSRVQEITIFIIVAGMLGMKSRRASQLLMRQADLAAERANLSRYFAPSMVEELAHRNEPMGGVRSQEVAVLFADIVGFTRYAEAHTPDDVISLLREFHAALEEVVFSHGGTLDKYMGDGLMASFGTPSPSPDDAASAISAAFAMLESIARLNADRAGKGLQPIRLSVGVHYGPVILGDIGNARRMEFAMLGDTVNVASRLEAATRILSCGTIISQAAMEAVSDTTLRERFRRDMRFHKGFELKGRSEGCDIWTAP